jgi:hypothetical protein
VLNTRAFLPWGFLLNVWRRKVNSFVCLINLAPRHEGVRRSGGIAPPFLTSALVGSEWSASRTDRFILGDRSPGTHCIGSWAGPRNGLDAVENPRRYYRRSIADPFVGLWSIADITCENWIICLEFVRNSSICEMRDPTSYTSVCGILWERLEAGHKYFQLHWDKWTSHGTCFVRKERAVNRITVKSSRHIRLPQALMSSRRQIFSFRYWMQNCTGQVIRWSLQNKRHVIPCNPVVIYWCIRVRGHAVA